MTTAQKPRATSTDQDTPRAAIYARVSDDKTGQASSTSQQREACRELIARRGWIAAGEYVDDSITGTGKKHRPRFYAMLEAVRRGEVDAIVARHMDRIARNPRERLTLVEACRENGVIIALVQGTDMDPTNASGRMVIGVLGEMAEMEIGLKSERHVAALARHAKAGKVPHGRALLGYTTTGEIVPADAAIVRRIFDGFAGGESLRSLTRALTDDGVPTRLTIEAKKKLDEINADPDATDDDKAAAESDYETALATPWSTRTIRGILTNPRYAGWALYQREIAVDKDGNRIRGQWDALVDPDDFDVIQARLADPARKTNHVGTHRRYLGSNLFVCDDCGEKIETVDHRRYTCHGQHALRDAKGVSVGITRDHAPVDEFVIEVIAERLSRPDFAALLAPDKAAVKPLTDAARKLRRRLEIADNDYAAGEINAKLLKKTQATIMAELSGIESKLTAMTSGAALGNLAAAADPAAAFRTATVMGQRAIIDSLCTVRLQRVPRGRPGRGCTFDTSSVVIDWKN